MPTSTIIEPVQQTEETMENEKEWKTLFQTAPVGLFRVRREDSMILAVNQKLCEILKLKENQLVGRPSSNFWADNNLRQRMLEELDKTGSIQDFEADIVVKKGEIRTLLASFHLTRNGSIIEGSLIDISARKKSEMLMKHQDEELSAIYNNAPLIMVLMDSERRVRKSNRVAQDFTGRTAEEIIGLCSGEALRCLNSMNDPAGCGHGPKCAYCTVRLTIEETLKTGKSFHQIETSLPLARNGGEKETVFLLSSTRLNIAEQSMALVSIQDITERKKADEKLRLQAEMLDAAPNIITVHDFSGRFLYANRRALESHGYEMEEFLNMTLAQLDVPESSALLVMRMEELVLKGETTFSVEHWRKDNTRLPLMIFAKIVLWNNRKVVLSIGTDLTERKRMEEEKKRLENQLHQAMKMDAIGRLAGGVAHDFNNLLTVINNYSELAGRNIAPGDQTLCFLDEIRKAGERAADLTRQLLAFSRRQVLQPVVLDLNEVIAGLEPMLRRLIREDIEFQMNLSAVLGRVRADKSQIEQVLINLALNARDAMPKGGVLAIHTEDKEVDINFADRHIGLLPGRYVLLSVTDSGEGMDEKSKSRVFEPFYTTKEKGKGTGLGLSTVYGIVKQSGGYIWVESEPGQGTTFDIYLPREKFEGPVASPKNHKVRSLRGTETVLLVEDESGVREVVEQILSSAGYRLLSASKPDEAIKICDAFKEPIHMVLTDVIMPQMSGSDLADKLKKMRPDLKVLFMSGYTDDAIAHHGVLEPGTEFIAKPFTPSELSAAVRRVLDN